MIRIEDLVVIRNQKRIINSISCTLQPGKVTVLIGKSGAGKTTLLQAIAGLLPIEQGTISIDTKDIRYFSRRQRSETIGYVFQQFNLFPHMTALDNCIDPLLVHGMQKQDAKKRALLYFAEFGMQELAEKYPHQLSGGQQQRVAIIRALVLQPNILLLDEPTASLDPNNTTILITILRKITQKGLTVIVSSQDTSFTKKIADAIVYIDNGEMKEYCSSLENLAETQCIKSFLHD